jgi:hypothetical protein
VSEEIENYAVELSGTPRERELQAKLNRRTLWIVLLVFVALAQLLVLVELARAT